MSNDNHVQLSVALKPATLKSLQRWQEFLELDDLRDLLSSSVMVLAFATVETDMGMQIVSTNESAGTYIELTVPRSGVLPDLSIETETVSVGFLPKEMELLSRSSLLFDYSSRDDLLETSAQFLLQLLPLIAAKREIAALSLSELAIREVQLPLFAKVRAKIIDGAVFPAAEEPTADKQE